MNGMVKALSKLLMQVRHVTCLSWTNIAAHLKAPAAAQPYAAHHLGIYSHVCRDFDAVHVSLEDCAFSCSEAVSKGLDHLRLQLKFYVHVLHGSSATASPIGLIMF